MQYVASCVQRWPPVRSVDGSKLLSFEDFKTLASDEPLHIRNAAFARNSRFSLETLAEELQDVCLPQTSMSAKQGARSGSGCTLLVADQGTECVMGAKPKAWDPQGCSFGALARKLGGNLYLTTRSGKAAVVRDGDGLRYDAPEDAECQDVLVRSFVPRVPVPLFLPEEPCQVAFWLGSAGNNFGPRPKLPACLHSDLFCEQFLAQHQGAKEVLLLLPEDAAEVQPFPFLQSPLWYKSSARTVASLKLSLPGLRAVLQPGDVLFIPLWWWHEVRTVHGPSVSSTFRFHTEDAERFAKVMNAFYQFHKNAKEYGSGRLARHIRSYFACAFDAEGRAEGTKQGKSGGRLWLLAAGLVLGWMLRQGFR
ncbi:unnamed protein product [Effrenium voratum]|nr:unnamed protein product [Effrenium voratum]CAJ1453352.1 unnamed protein product [Effrenium voratum]